MSEANTLHISDETFDAEVINSELPVLLDFWAPWCGPCKMIGPIVEQLGVENAGKVKVAKMNVDDNKKTAAKFSIRGVPTLIFFKEGKAFEQIVGAANKTKIQAMIDKGIA